MVKIENWVVFPKSVQVPNVSCNLYEIYGLKVPDPKLIDDKLRSRFGTYIWENPALFNYTEIRHKYLIMYIFISPRTSKGESLEYSLYKAALDIAGEESIGTWDPDLRTTEEENMDANSRRNMKLLEAKVIGMNLNTGMCAIAFPQDGFEFGNLPQLLSVVVGNYNGMTSAAYSVRLEDLDFPDDYVNSFMGPQIGNDGIKLLVGDKITVGTIVKPKTGLSEVDWAKTAKNSYLGGLDVVKDDENLTSQDYCTFDKRAKLVLGAIKEVEKITGRTLIYVANVTCGDFDEMVRRAELIKSLGGNCLMIDIFAAGFTAIQSLRKRFPTMILHGHRAGHGAHTLYPMPIIDGIMYDLRHGCSMKAWTLIARLAGIDQLHIGAPLGKMEADETAVLQNLEACFRPLGRIKSMRPICSGGLKATVMWDVAEIMGSSQNKVTQDFIFQAGGGTHAHDLGTFGGAKSLVQARDAIFAKKTPFEAMSMYYEVLLAFRKWEPEIYGKWIKNLKDDSKIVADPDVRPYYKPEKEQGKRPTPVDLKTAVTKIPGFKADLEKFNPSLLKKLNS